VILLPIAGLGLAGVLASFFMAASERFWANWIVWTLFLLSVGLGSLFIVALEHLVGAKWSVPLRRTAERLSRLCLLGGPALLIALFSLPALYPWAGPPEKVSALAVAKAAWLNVPFFSLRTFLCVGSWLFFYKLFVGGSLAQDGSKDPVQTVRLRRWAPGFMAMFALTLTVVSFDWISSLEPDWFSDIFGVYLFAGVFLSGLAALALGASRLMGEGRLPGVSQDHLYNVGCFLFAFTVFWSYIAFAQYMLMWYANLPEEVFWYKDRIEGAWQPYVLGLALAHFVIPFFALASRKAKGDPRRLAWVAVLVLLSHLADLYWLILPSLGGPVFSWVEAAFALLFIGGGLLWVGRSMRMGEDMPVGDPFFKEGLAFRL